MASQCERTSLRGRPGVTSHEEIERAAFELFAERGFAATTLDEIASRVGVGKRTLFRYYPSKNDIPWGRFDATLDAFRDLLDAQPLDAPVFRSVQRAVVGFNDFSPASWPSHVERMRLILSTPELQAHSALRYAEWRGVISHYVARRTGAGPGDLEPGVVAHVALGLALAAYDAWLENPKRSLPAILWQTMSCLETQVEACLEARHG